MKAGNPAHAVPIAAMFALLALPTICTAVALDAHTINSSNSSAGGRRRLAAGSGIEFTPSVFVFTTNDIEGGACKAQVDRAWQLATRSLQVVVTTYWLDPQNDGIVDKYCVAQDMIEKGKKVPYCRDWGGKYKTGTFKSVFYAGVQACVQYAISKGFTSVVTLNPRLDQFPSGRWRAELQFNPWEKKAGWSYYDAMLRPHADMVKALKGRASTWRMTLGGEHQWTLTRFPQEYTDVMNNLRGVVPGLQLGPHLTMYPTCPNKNCGQVDKGKVQRMFAASDFVGFSHYPNTQAAISSYMLEWNMFTLDRDYAKGELGVDLKPFADRGMLLALEFGYGGGLGDNGDTPARTAEDVSRNSWRGIWKEYSRALDPWKNYVNDDVWMAPREMQRSAYRATSTFLKAGGGWTYKIGALAMWNLNSWDATGTNYYSEPNNSYRDRVITQLVAEHNSAISGIPVKPNSFGQRYGTKPGPTPGPQPAGGTAVVDGKTYPVCKNVAAATPDGYGRRWGWESNKTCVVPAGWGRR